MTHRMATLRLKTTRERVQTRPDVNGIQRRATWRRGVVSRHRASMVARALLFFSFAFVHAACAPAGRTEPHVAAMAAPQPQSSANAAADPSSDGPVPVDADSPQWGDGVAP